MNKKLIKIMDLKPGMVSVDKGYVDIILTVVFDEFIRLKLLGSDNIVRDCTFVPCSTITIYDPS